MQTSQSQWMRNGILILSLGVSTQLFGCAAAVLGAGAAGAGGYAAYTGRGAEADLKGDLVGLRERAEATYAAKGIKITERRSTVNEQFLRGKTGDLEVTTTLKKEGSLVHVDVVAREDTLKWDREYAKELLNDIVATAE